MDTAISNGDFICDSKGIPVELTGYDELLQRVLIRLTVKKGSFIYDTSLGSRLYTLKSTDGNLKERALSLVGEALVDISEVIVDDVFTTWTNDGENLELTVVLSINNEEKDVVITI
ncbi:MAG: histidine kinase [Acutalibacteraceae bacterium]